jgi:hypothetical protein
LTINAGKVLSPHGYRIFVKNTLTNNGTIRDNGGDAGGPTVPGLGALAGNMGGGSDGGVGVLNNPGTNGGALTNALGGAGGAGGTAPTWAGGAGGTKTQTIANHHGLVILSTSAEIRGGTGGGGGASNSGGSKGGAAGGGGGVIIIACRIILNNGAIQANGGKGGDGEVQGGFSMAGGGGGGGGAVVIVYRAGVLGTITVTGGAVGTGSGPSPGIPVVGATGLSLPIIQEA